MRDLQNVALSLLAIGAYLLHSQGAVDFVPGPATVHRIRLRMLAAAIDEYVVNEGHLPATLDDLPSPPMPDPGCIDPDARPRDDYRRDPDGVHVDYTIVDARSLRFRIATPGHTTKAGAWVPNTHVEESAQPASPPR